jgi:hypothetical protein
VVLPNPGATDDALLVVDVDVVMLTELRCGGGIGGTWGGMCCGC